MGAVSLFAWSSVILRRIIHFVVILSVLTVAVVSALSFHPHSQARDQLVSYPQVRSAQVNVHYLHRLMAQAATRSMHRVALREEKIARARAARLAAQRAAEAAQQNVQSSVSRETGGIPAVWAALAECESGGNWAINTGNGFYGGVQFTMGTWQSYGGTGAPQDASPSVQIMVARRILTTGYGGNPPQGVNAWPVCGPRVGLQPGD